MLWPVVVTDKSGKVLYKNSFATKTKLVRKGTNICRIFRNEEDFLTITKMCSSGIIECKPSFGISHAVIMCEDDTAIIFFIVNTMLVRTLLEKAIPSVMHRTFTTNELIIKTYKNMCKSMDIITDNKAAELLKYNSLRYFRAARNYELYYSALTKSFLDYPEEAFDIGTTCKIICERYAKQISSLGYRFYADFKNEILSSKLQSDVFLPVLLETASIALKIADDRTCSVYVYSHNLRIRFEYTFNCCSVPTAEKAYSAELDFIRVLCDTMGWNFSGITEVSNGVCNFTFSVPVATKEFTVHAHDPYELAKQMLHYEELTDSIVARLYFGE